jgi:hypothetical protein
MQYPDETRYENDNGAENQRDRQKDVHTYEPAITPDGTGLPTRSLSEKPGEDGVGKMPYFCRTRHPPGNQSVA